MNRIAIDYETHLIGNGTVFPKPVCISAYNGSETFLFDREETKQYLSEHLNKSLIIAHNAVFECGVTIHHYPDLTEMVFDALDNNLIYCTKINESLWNIQREKQLHGLTLAGLVQHHFDTDISETKTDPMAWRLRYSELDGIPIEEWPPEARSYAIDDSIWAYKVWKQQRPIEQNLALKSAVYLNLMGSQGFSIDQDRVLLLEKEIWEFLTPRYDFLVEQGFCDYIPRQKQPRKQVKKLKEYVEGLGVDLMYTVKGATATSGEALASYLTQKECPILKTFSELSKYEKILTTYINRLKGAPKIYSQYSTTLNTGRTSSSASKLFDSVNIQNQPKEVKNVTWDIRNCYIPRPGFKICSIDYAALELRAVAHQLYTLLGFSKLRDILNSGDKPVDPHSVLAAKMKGIEYYEDFKKDHKTDRDKIKEVSLGLPGGMGYDTIRHTMWKKGISTKFQVLETSKNKKDLEFYLYRLGAPDVRIRRVNKTEYALVQDELVKLKRYVFDLYPDLEMFLKEKHTSFLTGKTKFTKNDFGEWEEEPLYMYDTHGFKRDFCTYTALCNGFLMQTPSAIGAQKAMNKLIRTFYNNPDIFPQAFIHDECVFEVREHRTDLIEEAAYIMINEMQTTLPSVRIAVEASISDHWQKADGFWTQSYWRDAK